jgi:hypothetical protein
MDLLFLEYMDVICLDFLKGSLYIFTFQSLISNVYFWWGNQMKCNNLTFH